MKSIIATVALCVALGGCITDQDHLSGAAWMEINHPDIVRQQEAQDEQERHDKAMETAQSDRDFQMQSLNDSVSNLNQQIQNYNDNH